MTAAARAVSVPLDEYVPVCTAAPERWITTSPDAQAVAACQVCARRWLCAREAYQGIGAEGLWAGVVIPESGRGRGFALRRLRVLAERGGYPVAARHRGRPRGSRN